MLSQNNDTYSDIRELLGTEKLTPDLEQVISVMHAYRPRVEIDTRFRSRLKDTLISGQRQKLKMTRPSRYLWLGWIGSSFAALALTFSIVKILMPMDVTDTQVISQQLTTVAPDMMPMHQDAIREDNMYSEDLSQLVSPKSLEQPPVAVMMQRSDSNPSGGSNQTSAILTDMPTTGGEIDTSLGQAKMMAVSQGAGPMQANSVESSESVSLDTTASITSDINSEMQDMISEINTIIQESGKQDSFMLPDYPDKMTLYIKEGIFDQEEIASLVGSGIMGIVKPTYTRDVLVALIREKQGNQVISGTPSIRYRAYQRGGQSFLIPTVIYNTSTGVSIELPLISYE